MNTLPELNEFILNAFYQCGFSVNVYTTSENRKSQFVRSLVRHHNTSIKRTLVITLVYRDVEIATCRGILSTGNISDQELLSFSIDWIGVIPPYRKRNIGILLLNLFMITVLLRTSNVEVFTLDDETDKPDDRDNIYVKTGFRPIHPVGPERFKLTSEFRKEVEDKIVFSKLQEYVGKLIAPQTSLSKVSLSKKASLSKVSRSKTSLTKVSRSKKSRIRIRTLRLR